MKKILFGAVLVIAIGGYLWWSMRGSSAPSTVTSSVPAETTNPGGDTSTSTASAKLTDGTYTGSVESSVYGPVQVAITISGGVITSVAVPQFPNAPGHTTDVSAQAIPLLKQEVVTSQSAHVDSVSGATQTSEAFNQSLATAFSQAS